MVGYIHGGMRPIRIGPTTLIRELGRRVPSGCFPGGASPYGIEELSGNVWERTRSVYDPYPYPTAKEAMMRRENLEASRNTAVVLRGGAFNIDHGGVRCAYRGGDIPLDWDGGVGFRVVVRPYL